MVDRSCASRTGCDHRRVRSASALQLLDSAAAGALEPLGLIRVDGSVTWVDDHGWWVVGVDFETVGRGRGTRLVVFADFLWHGRDRLVRSVAARVRERGRLLDQDGCELECGLESGAANQDGAAGLAARAATELRAWREGFPTLRSWAAYLDGSAEEGGLWREYDAGVAAGLAGDGRACATLVRRACSTARSARCCTPTTTRTRSSRPSARRAS